MLTEMNLPVLCSCCFPGEAGCSGSSCCCQPPGGPCSHSHSHSHTHSQCGRVRCQRCRISSLRSRDGPCDQPGYCPGGLPCLPDGGGRPADLHCSVLILNPGMQLGCPPVNSSAHACALLERTSRLGPSCPSWSLDSSPFFCGGAPSGLHCSSKEMGGCCVTNWPTDD